MAASAFTQLTSIATAATLGANAASGAYPFVYIQPDDGAIYMRDDGTDPTGAVGLKILSGERFPYTGDLSKVKVIAATTSGATKVNLYFIGTP